MQGLSGFDLPPSGKFFKSNFSKTPDVSARRSRAFFTSLNLPFSTTSFRELDRQWLSRLNPVLSEDSPNPGEQSVARPTEPARFLRSTTPRVPQAPQIHRSTEPGSSPVIS